MADLVWYARMAKGVIASPLASVASATGNNLFAQVTAVSTPYAALSLTTHLENVEITEGEMDVEEINTFGATQRINMKRPTMYQLSCDMVFSDSAWNLAQTLLGAPVAATTSYVGRYRGGESTTRTGGRQPVAIAIEDTDSANTQDFLLNNAYVVKRELKQPADSYFTMSVTAKCLAQDYYEEYL